MKKELYKNRFFLIPVIIATIISIIVSSNHIHNTYSGIEDYSIWSIIGYIVMVSLILLAVTLVMCFISRIIIRKRLLEQYIEENKKEIEKLSLSVDKSKSVYDEINKGTLDYLWEGEDSESIMHWDYAERKQNAEEKKTDLYNNLSELAKINSKEYLFGNVIICLICSSVALVVNFVCSICIVLSNQEWYMILIAILVLGFLLCIPTILICWVVYHIVLSIIDNLP